MTRSKPGPALWDERLKASTVKSRAGGSFFLRTYYLYGLCIKSQWPLPCPEYGQNSLGETELVEEPATFFCEVLTRAGIAPDPKKFMYHARLDNGADYIRWNGLFEFLISADGCRIGGRSLGKASWGAFQTYLLGQVISFALIKRGIEPLHSTVVVIGGGAVAFVGDCGYGKSSLGAAFVQAGYRLLTDDLLVITEQRDSLFAHPGPPRIKLFPDTAKFFLGERITGVPMNPYSQKLIIPLEAGQFLQEARPLTAFYALRPPWQKRRGDAVTVRRRQPSQAFIDAISNTFNAVITDPVRLTRQFAMATRLSGRIPFKSLSYPRDLSRLTEVVKTVCGELA